MSRSALITSFTRVPIPANPLFHDLTGRKFSRLKVLAYVGENRWACKCDCGNRIIVFGGNLRKGNTRSCGCLHSEVNTKRVTTHGYSDRSEYHCHQTMIARCYRPSSASFRLYGGRGISVCDRWRFGESGKSGFECFLADMGDKPSPGHSIDRIDSNGGYEPNNCRWATAAEQSANTRRNRLVTMNGETMILIQAIRASGLTETLVRQRLTRGWAVDRALATPKGRYRKCLHA